MRLVQLRQDAGSVGGSALSPHGRPSPYHRGAGRSLEVVEAGHAGFRGQMRSPRFGPVAALCCCTRTILPNCSSLRPGRGIGMSRRSLGYEQYDVRLLRLWRFGPDSPLGASPADLPWIWGVSPRFVSVTGGGLMCSGLLLGRACYRSAGRAASSERWAAVVAGHRLAGWCDSEATPGACVALGRQLG